MKAKLFLIFMMCFVLSACALSGDKPMLLNEETIGQEAEQSNEYGILSRLNELRMGKKPVAAPAAKPSPALSEAKPQTSAPAPESAAQSQVQLENLTEQYSRALIKTSLGDFTIELYGDAAPVTVNNFLNLAKQGFYDNTRFHRVIRDFMVQGGDPLSREESQRARWGTGGPDYRFADEINDRPLQRGSLAMANSGPNTNGSQFFIVTAEFTPWLDGRHTNFGFVTEGLDVVMAIEAVPTMPNDQPVEDVVVESIELLK